MYKTSSCWERCAKCSCKQNHRNYWSNHCLDLCKMSSCIISHIIKNLCRQDTILFCWYNTMMWKFKLFTSCKLSNSLITNPFWVTLSRHHMKQLLALHVKRGVLPWMVQDVLRAWTTWVCGLSRSHVIQKLAIIQFFQGPSEFNDIIELNTPRNASMKA